MPSYETNLYLYSEEIEDYGRISTFIYPLTNYSNIIAPACSDVDAIHPRARIRMGTLIGVYLPCIQNIFGVIFFLRFTWVVGTAGVLQGFFIIFICCCTTILTAISMSAIATNGVVPAGGSYYMISRSLGPAFGGAVGMLFYTGTTLAAALYIVGAVEIASTYIAPGLSAFGDYHKDVSAMYNSFRIYGTGLLMMIGTIVFVGVKFVNKLAALALACVIFSILAVYIGIFVNFHGNDNLYICVLGKRLLKTVTRDQCNKTVGGVLFKTFCGDAQNLLACNNTYFKENDVSYVRGIKGLSSGVFMENIWSNYRKKNQYISRGKNPKDFRRIERDAHKQVASDITTTFKILIGISFPSVAGIMAGSNRSGDLADAQKSIPIGTICAILTTSTVYFSIIFLVAGTVDNLLLRDKFGVSIGGKLLLANIAWPNEWVILIGSLFSTLGAAIQCLTGAPRLLQAIAKDGIIPFLRPFAVSSSRGEPRRALILSLIICQFGILLGNVDYLAPLLSMCFLMFFGCVNLACALQTLLRTPNWRPRFKYYHWSLSVIGLVLCIVVMFMTSNYYALIAITMAGFIYKYIEYRGAEKEWGDGIRGLALSAARYALLRLEEGPPHTKNWRPQILILAKLTDDLVPKYRKLITFAAQLKAGMGLTICVSVICGDFASSYDEAMIAKQNLSKIMEEERVKGFVDVLVEKNVMKGISHLVQTTGLGGLKPNTVILGWPYSWSKSEDDEMRKIFLEAIRTVATARMAVLVPKGIDFFPDSTEKVFGNIDIWWIVHHGGLLMLLPFLLKQHRTWKHCTMRIFTVAQMEDDSIQMKKDLKKFLYDLRIDGEAEVVEMLDSDISEYIYERTLMMEQRNQMLRELNSNRRESLGLVQSILDNVYQNSNPRITNVRFHETTEGGEILNDIIENITEPSNELRMEENKEGKEGMKEDEKRKMSQTSVIDNHKNVFLPSTSKLTPDEANVRRMNTAVKLNEVIINRSLDAELVILTLPGPPRETKHERESNYMEFLEVLTEGLERVLMVRGGGQEVITTHS